MITRLQLGNFKSYKDLSLPLTRRNVLIGPNMAGKSNLIAALRFLNLLVHSASGVHGLTHALNALAPGGPEELAWRGGESKLISLILTGDFRELPQHSESDTWDYKLDFTAEPRGAPLVQNESLEVSTHRGRGALIEADVATGQRILRNISQQQVNRVTDARRSALEFEIPGWDGNLLRNLFASFQFFKLVPATMKQINPTVAATALMENGSNLSSWLMFLQTRFRSAFDAVEQAAKDALPDITNILTWPTQQATVFIASGERALKTPIPVWQMSDGELCFIALLSMIFSPEDFASQLYCIEEPENHLHPKLLQTLVGLSEQRQRSFGTRAAQVIVTTHSLELVDSCRVEDLIVIEKREGASRCTRPSEKREVQELLAREELGLGELYYSGVLSR